MEYNMQMVENHWMYGNIYKNLHNGILEIKPNENISLLQKIFQEYEIEKIQEIHIYYKKESSFVDFIFSCLNPEKLPVFYFYSDFKYELDIFFQKMIEYNIHPQSICLYVKSSNLLQIMESYMQYPECRLKKLSIYFQEQIEPVFFESFLEKINDITTLTITFQLSYSTLRQHDSERNFQIFCDYLRRNTSLRKLNLISNEFYETNTSILLDCIQEHPNLIYLSLYHSRITDISCLSSYIETNKRLKYLVLSHNYIDIGWSSFWNSLCKNGSIEELEMTNMKINTRIADKFFAKLVNHTSIRKINLKDNLYGNKYILGLSLFLEKNKIIETILLGNITGIMEYHIPEQIIDSILMIGTNTNLKYIYLENANIDKDIKRWKEAKQMYDYKKELCKMENSMIMNSIFEYISMCPVEIETHYRK
jgi:hypothetical protein